MMEVGFDVTVTQRQRHLLVRRDNQSSYMCKSFFHAGHMSKTRYYIMCEW